MKFFITLDKIYRKVLDTCDTLDLSTLIGYGFWFIFGIWTVAQSARDGTVITVILSIFLMSFIACIFGRLSYLALLALKIALMGLYIPVQMIASFFHKREERMTDPGPFIAASGDGELWQAKYLHD